MDERERFITDHRRDLYPMADLCARYNVSRKTGYKWLDRMDEGVPGPEACDVHDAWASLGPQRQRPVIPSEIALAMG